MFESQYEFKVIKDHDVDSFRKDFDKVNRIKLDLKNSHLSTIKFLELFERLAATKIEYFQLDLSNLALTNEMYEAIIKCVRCWNLKTLILLFAGIKLTDNQFHSLVYESFRTMSNLENLYLDFESMGWSSNKSKSLEQVIPKLDSLNNIFINLRNNSLAKEDIQGISKVIQHIPAKEFVF